MHPPMYSVYMWLYSGVGCELSNDFNYDTYSIVFKATTGILFGVKRDNNLRNINIGQVQVGYQCKNCVHSRTNFRRSRIGYQQHNISLFIFFLRSQVSFWSLRDFPNRLRLIIVHTTRRQLQLACLLCVSSYVFTIYLRHSFFIRSLLWFHYL